MTQTARPAVRLWPFAVAAALAIAIFVAAKADSFHSGVKLAEALIAVIAICVVWVIPASWSLCAALVLAMFGSNWKYLGLPSLVAPDRYVLGLALLAIAVRAPGAANRPRIRFRPLYILMYVAGAYAIGSAIAAGTIGIHAEIFDLTDRMGILDWCVFIIAPVAFVTEADRRIF